MLIGLVVTPFILAPGNSDIAREPKMAWALVFSLAVGLIALYKGELKAFTNKWVFFLVGFSLLSFYCSANPSLKLFGVESGRFWSWEPLYQGIVFLLFTIAVASLPLDKTSLTLLVRTMSWCGMVMAGFVILQSFRLDQFFEHRFGTYGYMSGTLGNPVLIGPYLCLILPLVLAKRNYLFAGTMIACTVLTRSDVAVIGMLATIMAYIALKGRRYFVVTVLTGLLIVAVTVPLYLSSKSFREFCPDNQRFTTWSQSITDTVQPIMQNSKKIYAMTGIGPGSFKYLFHAKHNVGQEGFAYAHNDFVQVEYELGIFGFFFFVASIVSVFFGAMGLKTMWRGHLSRIRRAFLSGFIGLLVCSCGVFVLQIGTHIFYVLTILGLLYNYRLRYIEDSF